MRTIKTKARGLGFASLAIGLSEILAPRHIERTLGIGNHENTGVLRVLGVREIMHGLDILTHRDPTVGVLSRIAGDVLDGVLLARVAKNTRNPKGLAAVGVAMLGTVVLDMLYARDG
jgi:hypothetical protein